MSCDPLARREDMAALTPRRPVLDDLIHRPRRQQWPTLALMTRLSALPATRAILVPSRRCTPRISAGRLRAIPRTAIQPTLKLRDPLALTRHLRTQRLDLRVHPQQHPDHNFPALGKDRLSLSPLHTTTFDSAELCPPDQLNGYQIWLYNGGGEIRTLGTPIRRTTVFETVNIWLCRAKYRGCAPVCAPVPTDYYLRVY